MGSLVYVDTSALVALVVNETHSAAVTDWYANTPAALVAAVWCVPEFASALALEQRTGYLSAKQVDQAWERFKRLTANDVELFPVSALVFHRAAMLTLAPSNTLRAGDALHLACAEEAGARLIATLDQAQAQAARRMSIEPVSFGA